MIKVHIDDISIPENRYRREFDPRKLEELKQSILRSGLLHPPVVEKTGDSWVLRAGERRLRVLRDIAKEGIRFRCGMEEHTGDLVPVTEMATLSDLQRLEIEVEENVVRTDFTWQERSAALAALHELRTRQNPQQTIGDTASEVLGKPAKGDQRTVVSDALILSKYLNNPEVAKAKDAKEALKIVRRQTEAVHQAKLAQTFDLTKVKHKLLLEETDGLSQLAGLPSESFDVIVTDPPYGVGADNFGDQSSTGHNYEDSKTHFDKLMQDLPEQLYRVAKAEAHLYLFCDQRRFEQLSTHFVLAGWTVWPTMLIWYKSNGMLPMPDFGPRRTYECILYAYKGSKRVLQVKNDCIVKIPGIKKLRHAAQKPVALYCDLLSRSARPGDAVLDCFGGSGPILVAANRQRLIATYIENDKEAFNIAVGRALVSEIDDGAEEDDGLDLDLGGDDEPFNS